MWLYREETETPASSSSVDSLLPLLTLSYADSPHTTTSIACCGHFSVCEPCHRWHNNILFWAICKKTEGQVALNRAFSFPPLPETTIKKMSDGLCIVGSMFGEWCAICVLTVNDCSDETVTAVIVWHFTLCLSGSAEGQQGIYGFP